MVIVGGGVAGITAARTLREQDPQVPIDVYTDEPHLYYPRPRLYEVLSGEKHPQEIYVFPSQWYETQRIRVHLNRTVVHLDLADKTLHLADRSRITFDRLLLATGAHPFTPPIIGVDKRGVFTLRSMNDAKTIQEYAQTTHTATIIGGGLLGLEFAASLQKLGQQVTVVELFPRLLPRQLDPEGAQILKDRIEASGIRIAVGMKTAEILGDQTASGIRLETGDELRSALILISAGVRSNTDLAVNAGLNVRRGIIVNRSLQTSANDVYAAGDVAEYDGNVAGIIPAAVEQGRIAAVNMIGRTPQVYSGTVPSHTLKIVGIDLTSIGIVNPEGTQYEEIRIRNRERGVYKKLVLDHGKIVGVIMLGDLQGITSIKTLMEQQRDVTTIKDVLLDNRFDDHAIPS